MSDDDRIALINRLRALPTETEWFEFKRNHCEPQALGEYLSALANEACLASQARGYLVFGIDNDTHDVVGTHFDPCAIKGKGNQDLLPWLGAGLRPNTGIDMRVVEHPDGRMVLFEVGPARDQPESFYGTAWVRVGASKTELTKQPEKARALWTRGFDKQYYLDLILALLREHGPVGRSEVNDALVSKLPDRLGPEQKRRKVHNLLQELRRSGEIVNEGTRSRPRWNLGTASHKLADRKPPKGRT